MAILVQTTASGRERQEVGAEHPLFVQVKQTPESGTSVPVTSHIFPSELVEIPGIGTAVAYATAEAFGTRFPIVVPVEGTIAQVTFLDFDDEGINKELVLFSREFTATADNAAFNPSDADLNFCLGVISIDTWYNYSANQVGVATPAFHYVAPSGTIYGQFVTRGADNIAAGSIPKFFVVVI